MTLPPDLAQLHADLERNAADARGLIAGLSEQDAAWRPSSAAWSVAECLDHLAVADRVYLDALRPAAGRARAQGRWRRGPARPGVVGGWFVRVLEPPVRPRFKVRAPRSIVPRTAPSLADAAAAFFTAHDEVGVFLRRSADLDLARVRFRNPFMAWVRFSLATGLHVIAAHERRHLWQARRVLDALRSERPATPEGVDPRVATRGGVDGASSRAQAV